ncbi:MAG: hypothetical protein H7A33_04195 [Deltaproteobacteria bacterium]|nr:hypothetical protein [Deltaproteobacteria bacterium]
MGAINPIGLAVKGGYTQPSAITLKGGYTAPTQAANNNSFYAASSDTCNISPLAVQGRWFYSSESSGHSGFVSGA